MPEPGHRTAERRGLWREAERIVNLYPANGCRGEAIRHCLWSLERGEEPETVAAAVKALAERWSVLPAESRRWCPSLCALFRDERWRDSPELHPWRVFPASSGRRPVSSPSFPAAQPLTVRRL